MLLHTAVWLPCMVCQKQHVGGESVFRYFAARRLRPEVWLNGFRYSLMDVPTSSGLVVLLACTYSK